MHSNESAQMTQRMLERSVLASVIAGDVLPSGLMLAGHHFRDDLCSRVFAVLMKMERERQAIDLTNLCMADETLDAGAVVELAKERCVSTVICEQNCAHLRERATGRALEALLEHALQSVRAGGSAAAAAAALRESLARLMGGSDTLAGRTMMELIVSVLLQMEDKVEKSPPVACGIGMIDEELCGGFRPGDLAVIAALTSVGKSAMLAFMMRNAPRRAGGFCWSPAR